MDSYTDRNYWEKYYGQAKVDRAVIETICAKYDFFWKELFSLVPREKATLLEIGAYPGRYIAYLANKYGVVPYGLDFNQDRKKVEETMKLFSVEQYTYIQNDFFKFIPERKFDIVYSNGFIEHFENFSDVLDKHAQWTEDHGTIMIMIPNKRYFRYLYGLVCDYKNLKAHNLKSMNLDVFRDFAARNKLSIHHLGYYGGFAYKPHQKQNVFQRIIYRGVRFIAKRINPWLEKHPSKYYSSTIIAIFKK